MPRPVLWFAAPLFLVLSGCGESPSISQPPDRPAVAVETAPVELTETGTASTLTGTVRPSQRATLAAKVLATVASVERAVGDAVRADDVIATLHADEWRARANQAQARLAHASREHEREAALLQQGAATPESVRALADQRDAAVAALAEAETMLGYTRITAPFAGVVTRAWVKEGDLAAPGAPLFALEATQGMEVEVHVPETLPVLATGAAVRVEVDDRHSLARLREASPAADPETRSRLAKLALPDDHGFGSGQFVRVQWPTAPTRVFTAPAAAVSVAGQMDRVFVVADGRAILRLVRTGSTRDGRTVILAGVSLGERVIVNPPAGLRDGQPVEPAR